MQGCSSKLSVKGTSVRSMSLYVAEYYLSLILESNSGPRSLNVGEQLFHEIFVWLPKLIESEFFKFCYFRIKRWVFWFDWASFQNQLNVGRWALFEYLKLVEKLKLKSTLTMFFLEQRCHCWTMTSLWVDFVAKIFRTSGRKGFRSFFCVPHGSRKNVDFVSRLTDSSTFGAKLWKFTSSKLNWLFKLWPQRSQFL